MAILAKSLAGYGKMGGLEMDGQMDFPVLKVLFMAIQMLQPAAAVFAISPF